MLSRASFFLSDNKFTQITAAQGDPIEVLFLRAFESLVLNLNADEAIVADYRTSLFRVKSPAFNSTALTH